MEPPARTFPAPVVEQAVTTARLPLAPERVERVGAALAAVYALIDGLDAVPLGEEPPATAFDARWE